MSIPNASVLNFSSNVPSQGGSTGLVKTGVGARVLFVPTVCELADVNGAVGYGTNAI